MMCYKDMTFCMFHLICKKGYNCELALTDQVKEEAAAWWGGPGAPICVYSTYPDCFVPFFEMVIR